MIEITIKNLNNKVIRVIDETQSLLHHLQYQNLDWMHACGGKGRCTTCKVIVIEGLDNLNDLTAAEQHYRNLGAIKIDQRLSCQAVVKGDIVIEVPSENQLPHVYYSS